jgi:hypothetical protein
LERDEVEQLAQRQAKVPGEQRSAEMAQIEGAEGQPTAGAVAGWDNSKTNQRIEKVAPLRSWTQDDLDAAIREYKAARASIYRSLAEEVQKGRLGAIRTARQLFGRNAIARALRVRARAMVTKSAAWQEIARELRLLEWKRSKKLGMRIGVSIADEQRAEQYGNATEENVLTNEAIRRAKEELPSKEAQEIIDKLAIGEFTAEQANEIIDLCTESSKEEKQRKIRQRP